MIDAPPPAATARGKSFPRAEAGTEHKEAAVASRAHQSREDAKRAMLIGFDLHQPALDRAIPKPRIGATSVSLLSPQPFTGSTRPSPDSTQGRKASGCVASLARANR